MINVGELADHIHLSVRIKGLRYIKTALNLAGIKSLSENTKRGLRQKALRGEFPSWAPVGYLNVTRSNKKIIIVDKKRAPIIKKVFEMFSKGNLRIMDIGSFLAQNGITTRGGKIIPSDQITYQILTNPFYYGHFRFKGEVYEGVHTPIITKKLWDLVQEVWRRKTKIITKERVYKPFLGLFRCGQCGFMITAQQTQNVWLEPMKQWIMEAANAANIARGDNLEDKKVLAQKIFGSNLTLTDRIVCCRA